MFFFSVFQQTGWLQTKDAINPTRPDERHQTCFSWHKGGKKKDTCATLSKAVNVLSHNSQGPRLGSTSLWEKPWLDMVEPASLASGSPGRGGHVWKLLPQSISKVQVLKYLSRAELHPCGGPSEHSSCTLKGYSESRAWGGYTLKSMGVPLTEWLSAECNGSPLIYCQYVGQGAFDKVCFKKKKEKEKLIFKFDTADSKKRSRYLISWPNYFPVQNVARPASSSIKESRGSSLTFQRRPLASANTRSQVRGGAPPATAPF